MTIADPVGMAEIAERLAVPLNTVQTWRKRSQRGLPRARGTATPMPEPAVILTQTPIWRWKDIERWAQKTGRL